MKYAGDTDNTERTKTQRKTVSQSGVRRVTSEKDRRK